MIETSALSDALIEAVALAIAKADGDENKDAWQWRRHSIAAIKTMQELVAVVPAISNDPIGLNWTIGEETHRYLEEIRQQQAAALVRPGDPRLNTLIVGAKND